MNSKWIVHFGLCAAAAVLVGSLGILFFQGSSSDSVQIHSLQPAQIRPPQSPNHDATPAVGPQSSENHSESASAGV